MTSRRFALYFGTSAIAVLLLLSLIFVTFPAHAQHPADPSTGHQLAARKHKMVTFIVTVPYDLKAGEAIVVKVPASDVDPVIDPALERLHALSVAISATVWSASEWANCKPCAALPLKKGG